ncbi:MAG: SatD family protein [Actinomycetota bacterium]
MKTSPSWVAIIVDVSRSRSHPDRSALQRELEAAFDRVNALVVADQPLAPTVGDEFQAVFADLGSALHAILLARLFVPEGVECRFGIGRGNITEIGSGVLGMVQDGSAWWSAREAIDEARRLEYSRLSSVRSWYRSADGQSGREDPPVNAWLLARDQMVGSMSARARRLLLGQLLGFTQKELAAQEGISQSAVSQSLSRSGANILLAGDTLVNGGVL